MVELNYLRISHAAKKFKKNCPPSIDWEDLTQESYLRQMLGRKSTVGPMIDLIRKESPHIFVKNKRFFLVRISLDAIQKAEHRDAIFSQKSS